MTADHETTARPAVPPMTAGRYITRFITSRLIATATIAAELTLDLLLGKRDDHDKPLYGTAPNCPDCGRPLR